MTQTPRLAPGDAAPEFSLPTDTGDTLSLKELRGRKVVLYAYPAAMTPGCTTQACDFRDSLASLQAAGFEVIGISPDKPAKLAQFREHDEDGKVERAMYNVKATGHVAKLRKDLGLD
jgi:peroxiredoxin Q/BCP